MRVRSCAGVLQRVFNCAKASAGSVTEAHRPIVGLTRSLHHWSGAELSQCVAPSWGAASAALSPAWSRGLRSSAWLQAAMEVKVPQMGESVSEGTIAAILKKPGEGIKEDDVIAQIETDKVTVDVKYSMKEGGVLTHVLVAVGDTVSVGQVVASVDQGKEAPAAPEQPKESKEPKEQKGGKEPKGDKQKAPVEPKIEGQRPEAAKAEGGPEEAKPEGGPKQSKPEPSKTEPKAPSPQPSKGPSSSKPPTTTQNAATAPGLPPTKPERRVKMTRLRMRVAERLKGAQNTYAMLTTFNEVDMTALMDMRNAYKDTFLERHGVKLGFMSAFVRAAAEALREVPSVNGVIEGDEIVYRDYVDISIAVATPKGLVVPVLRNADSLSFAGVEKSLAALGKKARDGTISIDDMAGGTFTISNGGVYGSMMSTPIINPPQSAILGMHAINQRAMVINGKIEARPMMYVALTYDHRLIDGREAVTFLKKVKDVVEDPRRILLDA